MANREKYLKMKLQDFTLEEIFEQLDLDPEETLLRLHYQGYIDLDYLMDDEFFEAEELGNEEDS